MAKDTRKEFLALLDKTAPELARAFRQAFADMTSRAQIGLVEDAIGRGDFQEVVRLLQLRPESFAAFDRMIDNAFYQGGVYQMSRLPKRISTGSQAGPLVIRFNGRSPRAEAWAREKSSQLIQEVVEDQVLMIRETISEALEAGRNPRATALDITGRMQGGRRQGGLIGLHSRQAAAVKNLRAELRDPAKISGYFNRDRRDRRFDNSVRRAMQEGRALSTNQIDKIAGRYADRLLALRGEMVARSETQAALSNGRLESVYQLVENGTVSNDAVTLRWDATGDGRTRPDHLAMDGQVIKLGQPFIFPDGSRALCPGDSSLGAPAKQIVACRCYMEIVINWLAMAA